MLHEIQGRVLQIDKEISGEGRAGTWTKQEFTIETQEQFPKKVHFAAWGEKTFFVKDLQDGELIKVVFSIESREYNQRWYSDLRIFKIEKLSASGPETPAPMPPDDSATSMENGPMNDDLPF